MAGSTWQLQLATKGPFVSEKDKGKASSFVRNASLTQTYSFLPASWAGDTHEETDALPIGKKWTTSKPSF